MKLPKLPKLPKLAVIVPVYKNAETIQGLITRLSMVRDATTPNFEAVFVVDGSPDSSLEILTSLAQKAGFSNKIIEHSRNFGSFAAIRTGLQNANGDIFAVVAADLQEPPELVIDFYNSLITGEFDIAVGKREERNDSKFSVGASNFFWGSYRILISREVPRGGVDVFACSNKVREILVSLNEANSSLIGLLFWVGFKRVEIPYVRSKRIHGKSGWSFSKKLKYLSDSMFSFTDLPITLLLLTGIFGGLATLITALVVVYSYLIGSISEPGYTPLMLVVVFSTFSILSALGIVGSYVWRVFENTKNRPLSIVRKIVKTD